MMILFSVMKEQIKAVGCETLRADTETYFEAVFLKAQLSEYTAVLTGIFGSIAWPSDNPIAADVKTAIAQYGSVMAGQTLYATQDGGRVVFAMLWPWGDRSHITLKMGEKK